LALEPKRILIRTRHRNFAAVEADSVTNVREQAQRSAGHRQKSVRERIDQGIGAVYGLRRWNNSVQRILVICGLVKTRCSVLLGLRAIEDPTTGAQHGL